MIIQANGLKIPIAGSSVDAALCSPPYFGAIRAYSGPQGTDWPAIAYAPMAGLPPVEIPAQREALGHEPDPFAFVGHLLLVFREVRRVLKPGGTLAVNLGDSYAGSRCGPQGTNGQRSDRWFTRERSATSAPAGLPSKNLLLMPARFALAMQADGWILRSRMPGGVEGDGIEPDIVWKKASCMPESCRDRPTVDFEDVFIFSQGKAYFWDQEAGREDATCSGRPQPSAESCTKDHSGGSPSVRTRYAPGPVGLPFSSAGRNMRSVWTINPEPTDENHFAAWPRELAARLIRVMTSERGVCPECGAPWVRVVERRPDGRPTYNTHGTGPASEKAGRNDGGGLPRVLLEDGTGGSLPIQRVLTTGWQPSCAHFDDVYRAEPRSRKAKRRRAEDATGAWWRRVRRRPGRSFIAGRWFDWPTKPATVLDPFAGLGRTWEAARQEGRRFIGTDLGLGYCKLALARNDLEAMGRRKVAEKAKTITGPLFR